MGKEIEATDVHLLLLVSLLTSSSQVKATDSSFGIARSRDVVDFIYNMQFDAALQAAREFVATHPQHPAGYFYQAAAYWQWRLIAREVSQRHDLLVRFQASMRRTIEVAEQYVAVQPAEAAFYLGAAYGMQARMYVVEAHYLKALHAAKQGAIYLQQCIEIDPTRHDAYLGLGLYHYAVARAPALIRGLVQWLVGIKGDRARGLQEIARARTHGILAAPEAASVLAGIYTSSHEQHYHQAHLLLQQLVQRYPNNFDYRFRLLFVSIRLGLWEQARQISRALITDIEQGKPYYTRQWLPLLRYRLAETYVLQGNHDAARPLLRSLQSQDLDESLHAWITLRLGLL
jgi:tetratricopeptide (TPR) repeat protein